MSWRYKGGFIQEFFNPLTVGPATDYVLFAWGQNNQGQLGQNNIVNISSPTQVGNLINWSEIDGNGEFTIAIKADGTLWSWGKNSQGQLGQINTINRSSPVQVGALTTWSKITCGYEHSLAIKTDGTLWSWGRNSSGQLGQNNTTNYSSPVQVGSANTWLQTAGGLYHTLAVKTDGTLWSCGNNDVGQLGLNLPSTYNNRSSLSQVGNLTNWLYISSKWNTNGAIKTNGTLWSWGQNDYGELGQNNANINRSSPVQVGAVTDWNLISYGAYHFTAVKNNFTLWSCGRNSSGQLGQNNTTNYSSPVQVGSQTNWSFVENGQQFSIAKTTLNTIFSFGVNNAGQLGQNTSAINLSAPTQIGTLSNWSTIGAGLTSAFAIQGS